MAGRGLLAAAVILLVFGGVFVAGAAVTAYTYFDGVGVHDDNKKARDAVKQLGGDTSELDKKIRDDEELLQNKVMIMEVCFPLAIVFLVLGIFCILKWSRQKKQLQAPSALPGSGLPPADGQYQYPPPPPGAQ